MTVKCLFEHDDILI